MRRAWLAVLALAALALGGCMPGVRSMAEGPGDLNSDETVVVGRAYLSPPFRQGEQKIAWGIGMEHFKNAFLAVGEAPWGDQPFPSGDSWGPLKGAVETPFNQWFMARFPRKPFYVQMLMYYPDVEAILTGAHTGVVDQRRAYLPSDLKVDLKPDDQVVFIGTLVYQRNAFNQPMGVKVYGDLKDALPTIRAKLGTDKVRVALATR